MNNGTGGWNNLPKYSIYIAQGSLTSFSNLFVVLGILRYPALRSRSEYVVICGLGIADFLNQFAFLCAGAYRIILVFLRTHDDLVSAWKCMLTPHNFIWIYTDTLAALMLMVVSLDRLVFLSNPVYYLTNGYKLAIRFVKAAYAYVFVSGTTGVVLVYVYMSDAKEHNNTCFIATIITKGFHLYYNVIRHVFAIASIVFYIFVGIAYRMRQTKVANQVENNAQSVAINRQKRLTRSLAICVFCTLVFYEIPLSVVLMATIFDTKVAFFHKIILYCFMTANLNPMCNVLIYIKRHKEVRKAIVGLVTCKEMPPTLNLWLGQQANKAVNRAASTRRE